MNTVQKVYVGQRKQIHTTVNRILATYGTSLETYQEDVVKAKQADGRHFLQTGVRRYTAMRIAAAPRWAFRKTVKEVMVKRSMAKMVDGKTGSKVAVDELMKLHAAMQSAFLQVAKDIIRWDGFSLDFPIWQLWTPVGEDEKGEMVFQIDEIWTPDEFRTFISQGNKFGKDLAKWTVEYQLRDEAMPVFKLPDSEIAFKFEEAMHTAMDRKAERDARKGNLIYTYGDFYTSGFKVANIGDGEMSLTSVLANVGRVVSVYNRVMANLGYQVGQMLFGQSQRAGLESGDSSRELMGYTITTTTQGNTGDRFVSEDEEWKALQLDIASLQTAVAEYVEDWQKILPPPALARMDAFYHGGYNYDGVEIDDDGVIKTDENGDEKVRFSLKPFELHELDAYLSEDSFMAARERRIAYAVEQDIKALDNFKPTAITF